MGLQLIGVTDIEVMTQQQLEELLRLLARHTKNPRLMLDEFDGSVLVHFAGPFPSQLKSFLLRERLRRGRHTNLWMNLLKLRVNACFSTPGDRAALERIHLPRINRALQTRGAIDGPAMLALEKALGMVPPGTPIVSTQCLIV